MDDSTGVVNVPHWLLEAMPVLSLKPSCDTRFQRAFTACVCVFKVIALVWANQSKFFENATACSKCALKTRVATNL